ncbi:multidrug resistance-associated ABC transporter [Mycena capillaripes]|nr:multidrug resistance-associated ABC transporter [Mycena capillaripes]
MSCSVDACVRAWVFAVAPTLTAAISLTLSLPNVFPARFHRTFRLIGHPFKTFILLHEAEALASPHPQNASVVPSRGNWCSVLFAFLALLEGLAWVADASFYLAMTPSDASGVIRRLLVALSWIYATYKPIVHSSPTVSYDLLAIYLLHFIAASLDLGGVLFENIVSDVPLPPPLNLFGLSANLGIILALLYVTMRMPIGLPSLRVKEQDIGYSVSPENYTSLFGWITFNWVYPLIQRGTNTTLEEKDIWVLSPTIQSKAIFTKFYNLQSATLLRRIWEANSLDILLDFFGTLGSVIFAYASTFFLKRLLDAIDHPDSRDRGMAYNYAGLMFLCSLFKAEFDVQHLWYGQRAATRIRSELMAAIYNKALKRKDFSGITKKSAVAAGVASDTPPKTTARREAKPKPDENQATAGADIGKIVNLMSGDAEQIATVVSSMYFVYGAPLEFTVGFIFLYQLLGWSAFSGFIGVLAGMFFNKVLSERHAKINKGVLAAKDKRMGEVNELLGAIKFVKFFSWEEMWIARTMEARNEEMRWRLKGRLNNMLFQCVWSITPILLSIVSFFTYVWLGNKLTIAKAFTNPLNLAPMYVVDMIQARIAIDRIAVFLGEAEVSEQTSSLKQDNAEPAPHSSEDDRLGLENASFKWNEIEEAENEDEDEDEDVADNATVSDGSRSLNAPRFELKDISVLFPEGVLTVVTGPTASGKTALLTAVLGEMTMLPGGRIIMSKDPSNIDEHGNMHTVSYAAQTPWLRNESIRENILFGFPWDEERYRQVLECCALNPDLLVLEDGDATEIGAKGISLSGGQKARVALARACYARTKWVLLDDPLSAVDSHTARFLFDRLLCGPLLANRTVVLVTHHVELVLPGTHYLIRMKDGRIDSQGTLDELRSRGVLEEITQEAAFEAKDENPPSEPPQPTIEAELDDEEIKPIKEAKNPRKLVEDEYRETGSVKWSVYQSYLAAAGYWLWGLFVFFVFLLHLKGVGEKIWIKIWGESYEDTVNASSVYVYSSLGTHGDGYLGSAGLPQVRSFSGWPSAADRPFYYAGIYAAIGAFGVTVHLLSAVAEHTAALNAAHILYRRMLDSVVRATFRFHDTTPLGRMLNRFGRDVEIVDNQIGWSVVAFNSALSGFFVSVITVLSVFPLFVIPATIIGYFYRILALGYLHTGRDLRRMESNSLSPIFSDFAAMLEGVVTVRAFSSEKRFMNTLHERLDASTQLRYAFWMTNRWLLLNFDFLGSISVFLTACFAVTFLDDDAGLAGLAITSALTFSQGVYLTLTFWTSLELNLNSVERIVEYTELPQEPPAIIESYRPPAYWPSASRKEDLLTLENVVVSYAPQLPPVLHGISFSLKAGERVGLVGRTGSGKSTLATTLLRFVDPSSGTIIIDGIDISKIGLHDLRSRITFIPQDAALFSGTIRNNLDPFGEYEDSACMNVLYRVHLISQSQNASRSATPYGTRPPSDLTEVDDTPVISLDTQVSAGGANFSQGQRQLIALARALLRRSAIVILDEATSSTDAKIQTTIREEFSGSLLITVAHRLRTIMDSDRVIVLDQGKVAELDTPLRLMGKENGLFRTMCLRSGSFRELEAIAQVKEDTRLA